MQLDVRRIEASDGVCAVLGQAVQGDGSFPRCDAGTRQPGPPSFKRSPWAGAPRVT